MRLDKFLCDLQLGTRSQIKKDIKAGLVTVNETKAAKPEQQIHETTDRICYKGQLCSYEKQVYYMLYKPAGVVSATEDKWDKTVVSLLQTENRKDLFPIGRLDKDTEGLLVLTNDGALAHDLLSPRKHVEKEYECHLRDAITPEQITALEKGVDIGQKQPTRPAKVTVLSETKITLSITEGKFHQVKRMLQAVGNEVLYLKRLRMGNLLLDETLEKGAYRRLTGEEVQGLKTIRN